MLCISCYIFSCKTGESVIGESVSAAGESHDSGDLLRTCLLAPFLAHFGSF